MPLLFPWVENIDRTVAAVEDVPTNDSTDLKVTSQNVPDSLIIQQIKCNDNFVIPKGWTKHVLDFCGSEIICICKLVCANALDVKVVLEKEIIIKPDLTLEAKIVGNHFNIVQYGLASKVESLGTLEDALQLIDSLQVCSGNRVDTTIHSSISYVDGLNNLRHIKCTLVTDKLVCEFCTKLTATTNKKKR